MADNEELNESYDELIEMFKELDRQGRLNTDDLRKLSQETTKLDKAAAMAGRGISNLGNAAMTFGATMVKGGDEFATMSTVVQTTGNVMSELAGAVPLVGGALKALGKAATAAATLAIDRLQVSFNAFQELGRQGMIGAEGMSGLRNQMILAGIPMEKFAKIMGAASEDLSFLSGSALKGGQQFSDVLSTMQAGQGLYLRRLGFSIEEIGETVIDFQKTHQILGIRQTMTTEELAQATTKYGQELDMIAKITGQQRKEVQKNREQMMNNTRFAAWQSQQEGKYGKERTLAVADFIGSIRKLSPMMAEGMTDLFASGGVATTEAGRRLMQQGLGDTVMHIRNQMLAGNMDVATARREMFKAALNNRDRFRDLSALVGDFGAGIPFEEMRKMAAAAGMSEEQIKDLEKAQKGQMSGQDKMTDALTKMVMTLEKAQTMFDDLILSGGLAVGIVNIFTEGIIGAAKVLYKISGKDEKELESALKARDDAIEAHRLGVKGSIDKDFITGESKYQVDTKQLTQERMKRQDLLDRKAVLEAKVQKGEKLTELEKKELENLDSQIAAAEKRIGFMSTHRMSMAGKTEDVQAHVFKFGSRATDTGIYSYRLNSTADEKATNYLRSIGWSEDRIRNMSLTEMNIIKSRISKWEAENKQELFDIRYDRKTRTNTLQQAKGANVDLSYSSISQGAELRERYLARKKEFEETYKRLAADGDISEEDAKILRAQQDKMGNLLTAMERIGFGIDELLTESQRQTQAIKVGPVN